jgi:hypothetical protein
MVLRVQAHVVRYTRLVRDEDGEFAMRDSPVMTVTGQVLGPNLAERPFWKFWERYV